MRLKLAYLILSLTTLISLSIGISELYKRNRSIEIPVIELRSTFDTSPVPTLIQIDSLGLEVPIIETVLENNKWEYTDKGILYLRDSGVPGERGNVIFYGHNYRSLLNGLEKVNQGSELTIVFSDGTSQKFEVKNKATVTPDQTHILNQTEDTRITIITCTGFLDSKRLVVTAAPIQI